MVANLQNFEKEKSINNKWLPVIALRQTFDCIQNGPSNLCIRRGSREQGT